MMTDPTWRTSSYSGGQGNCVEVGSGRDVIVVRDTKDRQGSALQVSAEAWRRFAARVKADACPGACQVRKGALS
jgi:hypothetical protein